MVTKDTNFNTAVYSKEFSCHPVFRCKKCDNDFSSSNCCMIYVDETGRVYENWRSFINENVLPAGTMVTPRNGIYNFNKYDNVILEIYSTPKGRTGAKIMDVAMRCTSLAGFGAAGATLAASVVAAPAVATAAGVVSLGVGTFNSITSFMYLKDRQKHEQSININDKEAQSSYLNLLGGVLGVAAAGSSRVLTSLASAGKATTGIEMLVNGINISSIVLSGNNVVNGVLDLIMKYSDGEKITSIDILQLSASLVIFTHSVYNFQLASRIANDARVNSMKAYRQTLSNRQRKMFDKISKETIRIRGSTQGKMDVIRGINEIPDRQYLNDLYKINKQLNNHNVRPAYGESGQGIILNNELPVDTAALRQSVQHQRGPNILEQVSQPIPTTYNSDIYTTTTPNASRLLYWTGKNLTNINLSDPFCDNKNSKLNHIDVLRNLVISLPDGCVILLRQYGDQFLNKIADGYKFQDVILFIADKLQSDVFKFLMDLAKQFIEVCLEKIEQKIGMFISTESVLFNILKRFLIKNIKHITESRKILEDLKEYYLSLNPKNSSNLLNICPDCNGKFFKCQL